MENGYVVQGEVYAEPVLEAEVVTAEPIMGQVVGEVVPSATDHLPEALDGAPRLALVAAGSADALRFDHADVLRAGGEAPLSANGKHVGLYWPQPRNAWGHWDYIDLGCSDRVRPLRVKLEGPFLIWYSREHGEFAFDVAMWKLHEGRHLVLVKACAGNPGGPTRMSKDACGRDFVLHADGTIGPRTAQHLRLGVFVPKPPGPGKPCGPGWSAHQNIDMCGQGDVEIIHNWRATHSIEDLQRIVEQKGYSAFTVSSGQPSFGHAALKKFPYQLTAGHCKPITTCCNHPCTIYIWSGGGSGSPSKVAPATYAENGESVSVSASLYSPATSCHLANDGSLGASAEPAPYTLLFDGPPGDGVKFRLRAPDGRYLRSDGREGTPPQWSSVADAFTTVWILRAAGDPFSSPVQLKSPGNGGHEPCLCNDQPTGGWGGRVKGKWSWCPEGRGDAYWKLVKMGEVVTAEINLENELTSNQWSAGKPGGGPEAFTANPWRFNADHTFVTERDGCHGTWFVSGDKRSLRMDWQDGQRGNYAEFLRRPGFPPTCDNVGSSYGFMRSWSLTLRGGGNVVPATDTGIGGTYDGDGLRYVITATADSSVVKAKVAGFSFEMRKNSHTAWDGVLPPHMPGLGGAPIHWEFEPGLGAFTSKAPGKPTRRFVRLTSGPDGGTIEDLGCFTGGPRLNHGSAALGWKYHSNDEIARCFQDRFLPELQRNGGVGYFGIECGGEIFWCFEKDRHRLSEGGRHRKGDHGNHHTGRNHQNIRIPGFSGAINHIGGEYELQIHKVTLGGSGGGVPALERWPTAEGGEKGGGGGLQAITGTWVPTRLGDWRGCPVGKEARVKTYKYVVQGNGDWVDELYPSHRGHVEPAEESGLYEGYGVEPGRYPAKWRLQPNGVLVMAWGDQYQVVYYLVRERDPRTARPGGAAHLNNELNDVARNTDDTHRARDLVDQGADLSSTNGAPWHHTPLHQASYHGRYAMAETLVGLGAPLHLHSNPCGRGKHGTPLELARGGGHHAIAEMLTCNGGAEPVAVVGGAAPVTSLDDYVGQRCESFPNGQPGRIVETFQFTREGAIYVTTGTASGRNTYTRHGETLQHQQHAQITATLQSNGELAWSHGYGSRICGRGVARHEMDRGGGGGSMSPDLLNGCWVASVCPIPLIWAIYHNQKVTDDRVRGRGCAFLFGIIPIPFDEYRYRRDGTNKFVHEQDGNNVLTYDNPCCNVGLTNDKACGLITLRLCCHP